MNYVEEKISKKNYGLKNHKENWITQGWESIKESQNNSNWFWVTKTTKSRSSNGILFIDDDYGWIEICYDEEHDNNIQWNWTEHYENKSEKTPEPHSQHMEG